MTMEYTTGYAHRNESLYKNGVAQSSHLHAGLTLIGPTRREGPFDQTEISMKAMDPTVISQFRVLVTRSYNVNPRSSHPV
jgi:hypothetical protein